MIARFIAFEGGEGAGKSTQVERLARRLEAAGQRVVTTREPGGTPGAEAIRSLFVDGATDRWTPETDALLVSAARADHVARRIRPALDRGAVVLCDRYVHSTLAYQGYGKGLDLETLIALHRFATGDLWPDRVLWLDIEVGEGLRRSTRRGGGQRFEALDLAYHGRVRDGFRAMATADPERFVRIDAAPAPDAVEAAIASALGL